MDKNSLDSLILRCLYSGLQLADIVDELESSLGLELGLYSIDLQPIIKNAQAPMPDIFESSLDESHGLRQALNSSRIYSGPDGRRCCVVPMERHGARLGMVVVYEKSESLSREEFQSVSSRISKLCAFLIKTKISSSQRHSYMSLWLTGAIFGTDSGFDTSAYAGISEKLRGNYAFCSFSSPSRQISQIRTAEKSLWLFFPKSLHIIRDNVIIMFLHSLKPEGRGLPDTYMDALRDFTANNGLQCGISDSFDDLSDKGFYIRQSLSCLDLTKYGTALVCAWEHYCGLILDRVNSELGADIFQLQKIVRISDYDQANGTEYLTTLRAYLSSGCRVTAASKELYINHSTLNYRLKKLHGSFGIDLDNANEVNALRLGLINFDKR